MKIRKLTKAEVQANAERETARLQAWRADPARSGSFSWGDARPEVIEAIVAAGYEFKVKSGKTYRAHHTLDGVPNVIVTATGREQIVATMLRDGRRFGPVRWIDFANTDLAE